MVQEPRALLGISGFAGSGKDTVADRLVDRWGFVKISFADRLREMALAIDPIVTFKRNHWWNRKTPFRYSEALEEIGYNEAKFKYPEVRDFLQRLGTEAGRKLIDNNFWVNMAMDEAAKHSRVVIPDMRFRNEAQAVLDKRGFTVQIKRPGVGPANSHISEHDLAEWKFDLTVHNDATIEVLHAEADDLVEGLFPWIG